VQHLDEQSDYAELDEHPGKTNRVERRPAGYRRAGWGDNSGRNRTPGGRLI